MKAVLSEIQDGTFASQWLDENRRGGSEFRKRLSDQLDHPIESVGRRLRSHMAWLRPSEPAESAP